MINLSNIDFTPAEKIYAISNTPHFLLRRLSDSSLSLFFHGKYSNEEILENIEEILKKKPATLKEAVIPYVLLSSLALSTDARAIRLAAQLSAPYHEWYTAIARTLADNSNQESNVQIKIPARAPKMASAPAQKNQKETREIRINVSKILGEAAS